MNPNYGKTILPLLVAGNGRGAHAMLPFIAHHNQTSAATEVVLACVDAAPTKGERFAAEAEVRGVRARSVEASIEDVLASNDLSGTMVVYSALDRPGAVRALLQGAQGRRLPAVGYFLLALPEPTRKLFGIRFVIRADEVTVHDELAALLDTLSASVPRGSSRDVFGEAGKFSHHLTEPVIRSGFAEHLVRNAPKVIAGLEPESPPLEIATADRVSTLHVLDHAGGWQTIEQIIAQVLNRPTVSKRRGSSHVIAEIGPGPGLRFYQAVTRVTDGRLVINGLHGRIEHRELMAREDRNRAEDAARRQAQEVATISRLSPVEMTD